MKNEITVSACLITYNQEHYIEECIKSALMQQVDNYEIVIGDDCSTDGTSEICQKYAKQYPNLIKYHRREENLGMIGNWLATIKEAQGKYIALCEGDDYWTDPLKLQKQVDFLEENEDYGICGHKTLQLNEFTNQKKHFPNISSDQDFFIKDFIKANHIGTCCILFKSSLFKSQDWHSKSPFGDWLLILTVMLNSNQKIRVINKTMSIYRIHGGGIHGQLSQSNTQGKILDSNLHLQFIYLFEKHLAKERFKTFILRKKLKTLSNLIKLTRNNNISQNIKYKSHYYYLRVKNRIL